MKYKIQFTWETVNKPGLWARIGVQLEKAVSFGPAELCQGSDNLTGSQGGVWRGESPFANKV
jgi:hypothetical protein